MIKYKQIVILPKKPKMSVGKASSQVSHATFMALDASWEDDKDTNLLINKWKRNGMCLIVLQCKDTAQLKNIANYLKQWDIAHHLYYDEGRTEVEPFTPTALATGILTEDKWWIFEGLKLYK